MRMYAETISGIPRLKIRVIVFRRVADEEGAQITRRKMEIWTYDDATAVADDATPMVAVACRVKRRTRSMFMRMTDIVA